MIALIALILSTQEPDRWSEARASPVIAEGKHQGCSLTFKSVQRDNLYFSGRFIGADGSFNLYHFGSGKISAMLKVAVLDGDALRLPDVGYLIDGYGSNAEDIISTAVGDNAGYRLVMFNFGEPTIKAVESTFANSRAIVGVQVNGGKSAIPFDVDLTEDQSIAWNECVVELLEGAVNALSDRRLGESPAQ